MAKSIETIENRLQVLEENNDFLVEFDIYVSEMYGTSLDSFFAWEKPTKQNIKKHFAKEKQELIETLNEEKSFFEGKEYTFEELTPEMLEIINLISEAFIIWTIEDLENN